MKRPREVANLDVDLGDYKSVLKSYAPSGSLSDKLGLLVQHLHHVTPSSVTRASPLLDALLKAGIRNGVVNPSRMEAAVHRFLGDESGAPPGIHSKVYAHDVTEHVRLNLAMLRQIKIDEDSPTHARSRKQLADSSGT